jgi:DnaD/phage-associated family protein
MKGSIYKLKNIGKAPDASLFELLENADETDIKILIALLMSADENGEILLSNSLDWMSAIGESDLAASLKFWTGAGIIKKESGKSKTEKTEKSSKAETAHKKGAVERVGEIASYRTAELAKLMEDRRVTAEYLDAAQRILGKTFTTYETGIMAGLIDQLELEEEAVLSVVAYCSRLGKKSVKFIEKTVFSFYDEDITTASAINERIDAIERSNEAIYKVKSMFGAEDRELSTKEKKLFTKWTLDYGYDVEVIKLAYDITVDTLHEANPSYAGGILDNWYSENLKTYDDVSAYIDEKHSARTDTKSYDTEDFFEAALNRSYEKMKK